MPRHNTRGSSVFQKVSDGAGQQRQETGRRFAEANQSRGNFAGNPTNMVQRTTRERAQEARRSFNERFRSNEQNSGRG
ncbi:MAG: hypothetical protein RL253_294 [Bacteroidota bacterium]|jgi:hypothetical protein